MTPRPASNGSAKWFQWVIGILVSLLVVAFSGLAAEVASQGRELYTIKGNRLTGEELRQEFTSVRREISDLRIEVARLRSDLPAKDGRRSRGE